MRRLRVRGIAKWGLTILLALILCTWVAAFLRGGSVVLRGSGAQLFAGLCKDSVYMVVVRYEWIAPSEHLSSEQSEQYAELESFFARRRDEFARHAAELAEALLSSKREFGPNCWWPRPDQVSLKGWSGFFVPFWIPSVFV